LTLSSGFPSAFTFSFASGLKLAASAGLSSAEVISLRLAVLASGSDFAGSKGALSVVAAGGSTSDFAFFGFGTGRGIGHRHRCLGCRHIAAGISGAGLRPQWRRQPSVRQ